jgi:hypothetical protein
MNIENLSTSDDWFTKSKQPEDNRLIELQCDDLMGDFVATGMFVPYKKPKQGKAKSRFMEKTRDSCFFPAKHLWKESRKWRYV